MKRMALIVAPAAAALAATMAFAQPKPLPQAGGEQTRQERTESREQRRTEWRERRAERMQARLNEGLAKLRTDLKLSPEQVPLFETLEGVIKRSAERRQARWTEMRERRESYRDADLMERLDMMATRQGERAERSKELADAARPLWKTLSDEQKTVARRAVRQTMAENRERMREGRGRMEERRRWRDDDREHRRDRRGRDDREDSYDWR